MPTKLASWYDYPHLYDLAFRDETQMECDFFEAAFRKYCSFPVHRLLEPACGSGRLVLEMARRGYEVTGFDLSEPSLRYLEGRLRRARLQAHVFQGDMTAFQVPQPIDAAFNTWNTFRHLVSEKAARQHLECMVQALRPGGIYIVGLHLLPPDVDLESTERWTAHNRGTQVTVTLRVLEADRRRRIEKLRISLLARTPRGTVRLRDEFEFRMYTAAQFRRLLASVPAFQLLDVYDFLYDIEEPLTLDDDITDTLFILQRR